MHCTRERSNLNLINSKYPRVTRVREANNSTDCDNPDSRFFMYFVEGDSLRRPFCESSPIVFYSPPDAYRRTNPFPISSPIISLFLFHSLVLRIECIGWLHRFCVVALAEHEMAIKCVASRRAGAYFRFAAIGKVWKSNGYANIGSLNYRFKKFSVSCLLMDMCSRLMIVVSFVQIFIQTL